MNEMDESEIFYQWEPHFCDRRYTSPRNFDTLIAFLYFFRWFLENESILVGIFVANPCACNLNIPFLDSSHTKAWIFQKSSSKTNSPPGCWHSPKDVRFVVPWAIGGGYKLVLTILSTNLLTLKPIIKIDIFEFRTLHH